MPGWRFEAQALREPRPAATERDEKRERTCRTGAGSGRVERDKLPGVVALACGALIAAGSQALALKIPIQATLTGGGEVPPNDSPAKGLMQGTFDTDTNTLEWTVTYSGLSARRSAPFPRPCLLSRADAGGECSDPGRNAGNLASPFHGEAKIDATQAKDLKDGRYYFNLHSTKIPGGEIRGPSSADRGVGVHRRRSGFDGRAWGASAGQAVP